MKKYIQIIFLLIIYLLFCNNVLATIPSTDSIYQIKFNYTDYSKEQEIAYQYYLDSEAQYMPDIPKENIGIDMFDIDGDGIKEIFLIINGNKDGVQHCPKAGCPFAIIKPTNDDKKYIYIQWRRGKDLFANLDDIIKILHSKTSGWHDIYTVPKDSLEFTIWSWEPWDGDGYYYDYYYNSQNNNKGE